MCLPYGTPGTGFQASGGGFSHLFAAADPGTRPRRIPLAGDVRSEATPSQLFERVEMRLKLSADPVEQVADAVVVLL